MTDKIQTAPGPRAVFAHDSRESIKNQIKLNLHCAKCLKEIPQGISPRDWSKLSIGQTEKGIQIWCNRHNINVDLVTIETLQ